MWINLLSAAACLMLVGITGRTHTTLPRGISQIKAPMLRLGLLTSRSFSPQGL